MANYVYDHDELHIGEVNQTRGFAIFLLSVATAVAVESNRISMLSVVIYETNPLRLLSLSNPFPKKQLMWLNKRSTVRWSKGEASGVRLSSLLSSWQCRGLRLR